MSLDARSGYSTLQRFIVLSLMKRSDVQPKVIRALVRLSLDKKYCLRSEVKKVTRHISALSASGGGAALTVWKRKKRGELEALREVRSTQSQPRSRVNIAIGCGIYGGVYWWSRKTAEREAAAATKTSSNSAIDCPTRRVRMWPIAIVPFTKLKTYRIKRRLMALGWSKEDMTFRFGSQKDWMDILNMNTPVTERRESKAC